MNIKTLLALLVLFISGATFNANAQRATGFGGKIEGGYGINIGSSYNTFQFNLMPGYHFNENWFAGIGVGYENLNIENFEGYTSGALSVIPIFAHAQYSIDTDSNFIPFVGIRLGYAIGNKTYEYTDPRYNMKLTSQMIGALEVGCKYKLKCTAISLSVYYEYLDIEVSSSKKLSIVGENQTAGLKIGFEI